MGNAEPFQVRAPGLFFGSQAPRATSMGAVMKVRNSLKMLMKRHRDNQLVRRRGRVYIINKTQKRFKARQG